MIDITEKKVPHLFRNKYLRNAGSGSVNTSTQSTGQSTPGASVDVVKTDSATVPTDGNVLSALRALFEIRSRIVASDNTETELSEENTLSSLHTVAEINAAIKLALIDIEKEYLSKTKAGIAKEAITFLKGLLVGDNLAHIDANGDAEVRNIVARIKAKVATLEVTGSATVESLAAKESVTSKTVTASNQVTTLNLLVQALAETYDLNVSHVATMMRTIIKDYVSSEAFTPGLTGEGFKISKALNGDWNLEIDNIVVRKVMTIFELVISKVRSVNGGLVISPANGRIKSVAETTGSPAYYVIGIEGDMQFVVDDYVRCQVFSNGHAKFYCVRVSSISNNSILVLKSEFTNGSVPAVGDDLVQMGNKTNKARQGVIYLTASEDGKPRISVMDGVNSTSTVGKSKLILGCLDGITDTDFPADFQPSGYGLYAMNVFLKGIFVLRSGKTVESELTTTNAAVTSAKQIADAAKELANSANALLSDIASDNKLTPSEKQATKKEWEQIVSEKVKNDASADKYGVSKVACTTAYNALSAYITPLLASLTTTSDIVGATFRSTFKAYYDARADLLNSISAKAKDLADAAQGKATEAANAAATAQAKANEANTAAGAAQSTADGAVTNAATANSLLSDIANDNKFTATEKQQTKKEWDVIVSEKPLNNASAVKFYVSTAAYDTAYNALNTYITPLLASLSTTSNIVGSTFRSTFKAYYDARTNLLNAVSEKAKRLADDAQNAANAAQAKADTVTTSLQTFLAGGGLFESKITEAKEYADGKVNALQVGGRNLALNSGILKTGTYHLVDYVTSEDIESRVEYSATIWGTLGQGKTSFQIWMGGGYTPIGDFKLLSTGLYQIKFKAPATISGNGSRRAVNIYAAPLSITTTSTVTKFNLEKGNKPTDWTPAPEDVAADTEAARLAAVAAQNKANEAATDAATAQTAANNAASTANAAKSRLDNWSADGSISPTEKLTLKQEQKALLDEKTQIVADAAKYAVSSTAYVTAYTNYNGELTYHTATTPEVIAIRANFATYQAAYYTAKQTILNAISVASKKYAEDKANDAKQAAINDAVGKYPTKSEFSTSITQLSGSISLKANQTDVTDLGTRVSNAEAKITPDAIRLTVKSQTDTIAQDAAKNAVDGLQMGGRNLALNSGIAISNNSYNIANYILSEELVAGNTYVATILGQLGEGKANFGIWLGGGYTHVGYFKKTEDGKYLLYFTAPNIIGGNGVRNRINIYCVAFEVVATSAIYKFKVERGNKPTDWTPAPEDVTADAQAKANAAQAAAEAVAIAKATLAKTEASAYADDKVTAEEKRAIADAKAKYDAALLDATRKADAAKAAAISDAASKYPTKTELSSSIDVLNGRINLKVAQSDFDSLGRRVGSAESAITQQATQISSKVSTIEFDKLGVRVGSAESEIKQQANKISLMVKKDDLTITGIDITNRKIILTADSTVFKNNAGQQIAMFENNKLKVDLIDAKTIVTSVLAATNVTATNLTVTGNSRIAGLKVSGNGLTNEGFNNDAYVILRNDIEGTFVGIGSNVLPGSLGGIRALGRFECTGPNFNNRNIAMMLVAKGASGGSSRNIALDMQGEIITRPGSGEERTGKNLDFMISGVWVGSNKYDIILQVTNGLITSYRLQ